jgi:ubiquinol-cytochrome c reductase cytochrome b subunit
MVTPAHIVPEWYFLPFYAILRAVTFDIPLPFGFVIDAKLGGVLAMFGAVAVLFVLPWLDKHPVRAATFRPIYKKAFWVFALVCLGLGQAGALQPDEPFYFVLLGQHISFILPTVVFAQAFTLFYFFFFLVLLPGLSRFEKTRPLPLSIATPVLGGSQ